MTIEIKYDISQIPVETWRTFVLEHPNGNFFQSPECFNFFASVENYKPFVVFSHDNNKWEGLLMGVIIQEPSKLKGYFSRRCIVWGGPLATNDSSEISGRLLKELNNFLKGKVIYTEFRNHHDLAPWRPTFEAQGYTFYEHLNFIVKINSLEEARKNLSKSKKRQIDKSLQNGVSIVEATSPEQVEAFYQILVKLYSEKVKKPLPPHSFFMNFFSMKCGKYLLVEFEGKIIGGIMCPIYRDTIFEYFVAGLDVEFKELYPSIVATYAPIEYAAKNGLPYFDFMGAGKPDEDYGVREFKSKFGGELVNYGRFQKINNPLLYSIGNTGLKILKKFKK